MELIKKYANTDNIHEISSDKSIAVFKNFHDKLLKDGYVPFDNNDSQGPWGCFGYKKENNNFIIYLLEIYSYLIPNRNRSLKDTTTKLKKTQNIIIVFKYEYNEKTFNFSEIDSFYIPVAGGESWRDIQVAIKNDISRFSEIEGIEILNALTFNDAISEVELIENTPLRKVN